MIKKLSQLDNTQMDYEVDRLKLEYDKTLNEQKIRINDLKHELEAKSLELEQYKSKNSDISNALVVAVETAKQIENSSKNVYELEIKRLRNLYNRWEAFLNDLMKTYPKSAEKFDSKRLLDEFSRKIDEIIKQNSVDTQEESTQPIGIRNLISKMGGLTVKQPEPSNNVVYIKRADAQPSVQEPEINYDIKKNPSELKIKPIANMKADKQDKFNSLVDKFFEDNTETENAYSKALIRKKQSGFDLKEALNPTENLEEIMKDFDFFDDKNKK